jgi:hypothetical protein
MAASQFNTATLLTDGSVEVDGPLDVDLAVTVSSEVEFRFLLVQGDVVVQGRGRGTAGFWSGKTLLGEPPLKEGNALAIGLAFVGTRTPPGYETFGWSENIRL